MALGRVLFISNHLGQPRHARRVESLESFGYRALVAGYSRGVYSDSGLGLREGALKLRDLHKGRYTARAAALPRDVKALARFIRSTPSDIAAIWCFGLDSFLLGAGTRSVALRGAGSKLILELGDIRGRGGGARASVTGVVNRLIERTAFSLADGVVVTAPGHVRELGLIDGRLPVHVGLNRLSVEASEEPRPSAPAPEGRRLRIGVIGFFRYPQVLRRLVAAIEETSGDWELHFHGDGGPEIVEWVRSICSTHDRCHYHGPYRSPEDLGAVYHGVDVVWSVYDASDRNVTTAIPNKLFEAAWFGRPIMVAQDTALAELAEKLGIGAWSVNSQSSEDMKQTFDRISTTDVVLRATRSLALPSESLVDHPQDLSPFLESLGLS